MDNLTTIQVFLIAFGILLIVTILFFIIHSLKKKPIRKCLKGHILEDDMLECPECALERYIDHTKKKRETERSTEKESDLTSTLKQAPEETELKSTQVVQANPSTVFLEPFEQRTTSKSRVKTGPLCYLIVNSGNKKGTWYLLKSGETPTTIGRGGGNDIELFDEKASRLHAKIVRKNNKYVIHDLLSDNPLIVNGSSIEGKSHELNENDIIQVGETTFVYKEVSTEKIPKKHKSK